MSGRFFISFCAAALLVSGCGKSEPQKAAPREEIPPPIQRSQPTQAQPKLQTLKLFLGPAEIEAELALTPLQIQTGLMFRTNIADGEGMLFVFSAPHRTSFWMLNTQVPLSAAYISPDGEILEIHDLQPHNTNAVEAASARVQFVLETPRSWFERHNVKPGTIVRTEKGSLQATFFGKR